VEINVGGYEAYLPTDETFAANSDPAVYRASVGDEESEEAYSLPPTWNVLSIVLRDNGMLRFVKYVGASARGDRWDIVGTYSIRGEDN
jgi:prolyl 3-hydroxylase /prolyl 3,4-dihydroxylase